jgi:hypothetical protein
MDILATRYLMNADADSMVSAASVDIRTRH